MKKVLGLAILMAALLNACSDGVPHVKDPHNPVDADGKPIKGIEFMKKYCAGKLQNETCEKVSRAVSIDSVRGKMPKGW
jgi:hypothetical protein